MNKESLPTVRVSIQIRERGHEADVADEILFFEHQEQLMRHRGSRITGQLNEENFIPGPQGCIEEI